ncbi:uncharacterized protein Z520_00428 [Fonsecaea multimorphosa CBS 102226]|uniref:Large ribosomal subunit protein mL67 n=1 Tax=Fonsecaea multimorphosa CBS 102226 TaxID=1442371 RepID=A0A0D2J2S0_9EURO|nr:uncharacterized protein Z520_00428 [Fonsecaea multimorphosa CBS 102226]KIY03737.1 hypothetical protein Z520_00428 [Fonsecaea multimorphosa CBS 102226]OAL32434.1 hypothetical protein AYO22_00456 [Fonsecaea multimorphosa]
MAAVTANSMAHQIPPMSIPAMPRIRPPRMLKGEPHPNQVLQPTVVPKKFNIKWVQGKWRVGGSNAVKNKKATQDIQVTKALRHQTHGLDIYAYRHVRTNQVVYSLTRTLQETKILKQLLYHGKKTVPASVRPDMWTPYFSIHFPPTAAGALEGLFAFQKLRELSMQRQLSPPEDLIKATQEDIDVVKSKLGSPVTLQEMAARDELTEKIPKLDELLPKKLRGRKLMDQKATSVADAAFVLDWISSGPSPWEKVTAVETKRLINASEMTNRARRRINKIRRELETKAAEIRKRAALALQDLPAHERALLPLTRNAVQQLSMEHHGIVRGRKLDIVDGEDYNHLKGPNDYDSVQLREELKQQNFDVFRERQQVAKAAEQEAMEEWFRHNEVPITETGSVWEQVSAARESALEAFEAQERSNGRAISKPEWADKPREIKMYWADLNDGLFAGSWPRNVVHGALAPFGLAKAWRTKRGLNDEGEFEEGKPQQQYQAVVSKSVHVIGSGINDGWMPEEMANGHTQPPLWEQRPLTENEEEEMAEYSAEQEEMQEAGAGSPEQKAAYRSPTDEYEDVVVENRSRGLWGRVRGLFGR